jgi:hypothetical protein
MSGFKLMQAGAVKTGAMKTGAIDGDAARGGAMRHRQVTLRRFATWIRFAGAVALQAAVMILCFRAVGDKFNAASVILPLTIAILGLAMIGGGGLVSRQSRPAFAVRPRLRLVGDIRPEIVATTRRSAA